MTLHEEIVEILKEENKVLTIKEITDLINTKGSYKNFDGSPITEYQVKSRIKQYKQLFDLDAVANVVQLLEWNNKKIDEFAKKYERNIDSSDCAYGDFAIQLDRIEAEFYNNIIADKKNFNDEINY
ncbi:MAG: hypothetical protein JXA68_09570 [Ignavibacteriales bacterium]|nr:hypothetical protein [Ignavibacteriales bacterium]